MQMATACRLGMALKDSEARIRALTREVGTLREDLRRESKRRDRAVVQVTPKLAPHPSQFRVLMSLMVCPASADRAAIKA